MTTIEEIIAKNTELLEAVINRDVESARVSGITVSRVDIATWKFAFKSEGLRVYGDEIEILDVGGIAYLMDNGTTIALLSLMEEV